MALDITTDAAMLAVVPAGTQPTDTDWVAATWTRDAPTTSLPSTNRLTTVYWYAKVTGTVGAETDSAWLQLLVGPAGTVALPDAAKVDVWSKITDTPEVPIQKHGTVTIS